MGSGQSVEVKDRANQLVQRHWAWKLESNENDRLSELLPHPIDEEKEWPRVTESREEPGRDAHENMRNKGFYSAMILLLQRTHSPRKKIA